MYLKMTYLFLFLIILILCRILTLLYQHSSYSSLYRSHVANTIGTPLIKYQPQAGDILLFHSKTRLYAFDHVGLVTDSGLYEGIKRNLNRGSFNLFADVRKRLQSWEQKCDAITVIKFFLSYEQKDTLDTLIKLPVPFDNDFQQSIFIHTFFAASFTEERKSQYCSERIATILMQLGILRKDKMAPFHYLPCHFLHLDLYQDSYKHCIQHPVRYITRLP